MLISLLVAYNTNKLPIVPINHAPNMHAFGLQLNSSSHLGNWHHCGEANVPEVSKFVCLHQLDKTCFFPRPMAFHLSAPAPWFSHHQICEGEALGIVILVEFPQPMAFHLSAPAPWFSEICEGEALGIVIPLSSPAPWTPAHCPRLVVLTDL